MFISILIPSCNRAEQLSVCLDALERQDAAEYIHHEVIVSNDDAGTDSYQLLRTRFTGVRFVEGPGCGPAANRNHAAKYASGDWFAFLDDDCIPDPDYLLNIGKTIIAHPSAQLIEGCIYTDRPKMRYDEESPENLFGGKLWSCNLIVKRRLFLALQGFCEEYPFAAFEDVDFSLTVKNSFIPVLFAKNVRVCHPWRKRKSLLFKIKVVRSLRLLIRRHPAIRGEINRPRLLHHLFLGTNQRTRLLVSYRFRGMKAYFEDCLILAYYFLRI